MVHSFDALVAGAGPAGSSAARVLARAGLSVALIDRREFPRPKLCGGLLTWKTGQELERVFGPGVLDGVVDFQTPRFEIRHWDQVLAAGSAPQPFRLVKRRVLDQRLLDLARDAGAHVFPGRAVVSCDPAQGELRTAQGDVFQGRFLIGADGAGSVLRTSLFPDKAAWRRNLAAALEIFLPAGALPAAPDFPRLYAGCARTGYGWVFPNSDGQVVGLCGLLRGDKDPGALFRKFLDFLGVAEKARPALHGHPLPYGNWIGRPFGGRLLLAGDAAGMVEPLLGEGIFYAVSSGRLAAQAVLGEIKDSAPAGPAYAGALARNILPELRAANRLRWALFGLLRWPGPRGLAGLLRLLQNPLAQAVHGLRSYNLLVRRSWD